MYFLAKYNTSFDLYFPLVKRNAQDFAASGDYTHSSGDVKVSKDGGAAATATNAPSAITMGNGAMWKLTLTATEMQAAKIMVTIVDASTKVIEDQMLIIYTYGNASAEIKVDFSDTVRHGLTALPNAAAEAAGGLYTRGTGAGQINQANNGNIDANAVRLGGTTQTGRDVGASVLVGDKTGFSLSAAGINAIWDQLLSAITTASTIGKLIKDNLDATISSRSTYAGGDTSGTTTLLSRVPSALTITSGKVDVNDKTGFSLSAAGINAIWDQLLSAITTASSIGKLLKDNIDATISSRSTYAGGDTSGVTTLLSRVPSALTITAGKVDVNDKTGFALSAGGVNAIWDQLTSAITTANSIGKQIKDNLDATITSRPTAAQITTDMDANSVDLDAIGTIVATLQSRLTSTRAANLDFLDVAVSSRSTYAGADTAGTTTLLSRIASALTITAGKVDVNDKTGFALSAAGVAAVWDALLSTITTNSSIGKLIKDFLDAAVSSRPTAAAIADAVWDELVADHLTAGTTGKALSDTGGEVVLTGVGEFATTVIFQDENTDPVQGLVVSIRNQAQDELVGYAKSDADGKIIFSLNAGSYTVLVATTASYEPFPPTSLVVAAAASHTYDLQSQDPSPATSPNTCRVHARVYNLRGQPQPGITISFRLLANLPAEVPDANAFLYAGDVSGATDNDGDLYDAQEQHKGIDLLRSSEIASWTAGSVQYKVTATDLSITVSNTITIPDQDTLDLVLTLPI